MTSAEDSAYTAIEFYPMEDKESSLGWPGRGRDEEVSEFFDEYMVFDSCTTESNSTTDDDVLFAQIMDIVKPERFPAKSPTISHDFLPRAMAPTSPVKIEPYGRQEAPTAGGTALATVAQQRTHPVTCSIEPTGAGESISDSELLRLEGLSVTSPRVDGLPSGYSLPPSPATEVLRLDKKPGKLENFYSTIRKVTTRRPRPLGPPPTAPKVVGQANSMSITSGHDSMSPRRHADISGLSNGHHAGGMGFVTGFVEDPFSIDADLAAHPRMTEHTQTPIDTPLLDPSGTAGGKPSLQNTPALYTPNTSISTASWPAEHHGLSTPLDWAAQSTNGAYIPSSTTSSTYDQWWDIPPLNTTPGATTSSYADVNLAMHMSQSELPYDYAAATQSSSSTLATSGLMIAMPQPRYGMAAPLLVPTTPGSEHPRRRKPRAPSSGARHHHHHHHLALTSPRKRSTSGGSAGGGGTSPSPHRPQRRSTSMASLASEAQNPSPASAASVRKRRSWSSNGQQRTPSLGKAAGGGGGGFVNFTASDHAALMAGVAPSGSSKTKARREREAEERAKRIGEAFVRAGGDPRKLEEAGIAI